MPRLNGVETCRRLRSDPVTADATIIMLTAMSDQPAQERAVERRRRPVPHQAVLAPAAAPARRRARGGAGLSVRLGVHIGYWGLGLSAAEQLELVQEAERLGFDSVWTAEAYGSDAVTILAWLAAPDRAHQARHARSCRCPGARPR